jgi:hypothetical protein
MTIASIVLEATGLEYNDQNISAVNNIFCGGFDDRIFTFGGKKVRLVNIDVVIGLEDANDVLINSQYSSGYYISEVK